MISIRLRLGKDPVCPIHQETYVKGSTCQSCKLKVVPGKKPTNQRRPSTAKPKAVAPYTCGCGRKVSNSQGICPGENCP